MKALGGGHLIEDWRTALNWVLGCEAIDAVAVGMQSTAEVAVNCAVFGGQTVEKRLLAKVHRQNRKLLVESWCAGCGQCVARCPMTALRLEDGKAVADAARCVTCGYCGAYCPEFCLKII
jgi:ferredoxin